MNILVTGANGQLGNEMRIVSRGSHDRFVFTDVMEQEGVETTILDITDISPVRNIVNSENIDVIVNCAAYTNVDKAEDDVEFCELLNAKAVDNLAQAMKEVGGVLFHISTDYVFGQEPYNTPCNPNQKGTPTGVYGATKKRGEENIIASGCEYIILRTAWLYSEFGKNFCKTMLNLTATKPALKVVFDQCGTPTYAYDLAAAIYEIISHRKYEGHTGIYHYSNEGVTSWYDFTQMIYRISNNLTAQSSKLIANSSQPIAQCDIQPCYSSEYPSPVKRPSYSVLDKKTFKDTFGITVPYWVDSLEKCIVNIKKAKG